MPSLEQTAKQLDNLRQSQLLRLQTLAQEQAFWMQVQGIVVTGYAASIGRQVMAALSVGLTSEEILTSLQVGEQQGLPLARDLPSVLEEDIPSDYWKAIQAEAETYWANR